MDLKLRVAGDLVDPAIPYRGFRRPRRQEEEEEEEEEERPIVNAKNTRAGADFNWSPLRCFFEEVAYDCHPLRT